MKKFLILLSLGCLLVLSACTATDPDAATPFAAPDETRGADPAPEDAALPDPTDAPPAGSSDSTEPELPVPAEAYGTEADSWGLSMEVASADAQGLTLRFTQSGGEADGELSTGSEYTLEQWTDGQWQPVPSQIPAEQIGWDAIAWLLPRDATTPLEITWTFLYGKLPDGEYRISKTVQNLRLPGDYDQRVYTAEFRIPCSET